MWWLWVPAELVVAEVQLASFHEEDKEQANPEIPVFLFDNRQFFSEESAIAFQGARGAVGIAMASLRTENLAVGERVQAIPFQIRLVWGSY